MKCPRNRKQYPLSPVVVLGGLLILGSKAGAVLPQINYLGTVTEKNELSNTITVQVDSYYNGCAEGPCWTPYDYILSSEAPNPDAVNGIAEGDYVETSTIGPLGNCYRLVSIAKLKPDTETHVTTLYVYGDPMYIKSELPAGCSITCTHLVDCSDCGCAVCTALSTVIDIKGNCGPFQCNLASGENCSYNNEACRIEVTFHEGQTSAFPECTADPCPGPQPISNFAVYIEFISQQEFVRGDSNADSQCNIADAIFILSYLFAEGSTPACLDAADTNDDSTVDLADAVTLLSHLFASSGDLPPPFAGCGLDPTGGTLGCSNFPPCEGP